MLLSLQDAITPTHPTQGDTLGYKLLGFQPVNLLFCIGASRIFTDVVSVSFRAISLL